MKSDETFFFQQQQHFLHHDDRQIKPKIGFIYDVPRPLESKDEMIFADDSNAEWESEATLDALRNAWGALGYEICELPLDAKFFLKWAENFNSLSLVHSVAEGYGSLSREGWIASLCELAGVPCIGASPLGHAVSMKKSLTKIVCSSLDIPTAEFHSVNRISELNQISDHFLNRPHFIKPDGEGSGMGIDPDYSISDSRLKTYKTLQFLLPRFPEGILLETYLNGPEYTSALIGLISDRSQNKILPIAHIEVDSGVYGLAEKSKDRREERITFPTLDAALQQKIIDATYRLSTALEFHDFVRIDWKTNEIGEVFFLEANTLAGLSPIYSVLPVMAQAAGMSFENLLAYMRDSALKRAHQGRHLWYGRTRLNK